MNIRRIVTGHNAPGKSMVKWDSDLEARPGRPGFEQVLLWATDSLPAQLTEDDPHTWELGTSLANGSVFRMARYEPGVAGRWHRTDTIDYGIVLAGELWMQLDTGGVHMPSGAPPGSSDGGTMQTILLEFSAYPQPLHALR